MASRLTKLLPPLPPPPALPSPHFMGFAPLDTWARLLLRGGWRDGKPSPPRISPRYWPRLAGNLFTSALGTALTLPERFVLAPLLAQRRRAVRSKTPLVVFILGYYRSGTTHLHYLFSCDRAMATPRWYQVLAPQGFALSWTFLRYFLVPFLSSTRPQDDVAFGPEYPSEDDFASCNWSLTGTMPGRMTLPAEWDNWKRWQTLEALPERDRERFRSTLSDFVWKLEWLNPGRSILLKSPAHTARVRELTALFHANVRFIHLSRPAPAVLASNIAMHQRYAPFLLQDHPGDEAIRERVIEEYAASERAFLEQASELPSGLVARVRYQDLIADPMGEVERVYAELGMTLSAESRSRMLDYLYSVSAYRVASERAPSAQGAPSTRPNPPTVAPEPLAWMHERFGHDQPARPTVALPYLASSGANHASTRGYLASGAIAALCLILWPALAYLGHNRSDWLIWPMGVLIGLAALRGAGRGNLRLGLWAGACVLLMLLLGAFPATFAAETRYHHRSPDRWHHVWLSTRAGLLATNNLLWIGLGVMSAFRFASREHVRPPGL